MEASMMNFRFGDHLLRADTRQLLCHGEEVHLTPKALELLQTLLASHPSAVSKAELRRRLWPETFVSDGNLALLIAEVRGALHDSSQNPQFIRTVHGFGYAFQTAVSPERQDLQASPAAQPAGWLIWRSHALPMSAGANLVGRQPGVDVLLDARGVSRVHARVSIEKGEAFVEDLGSKNGTYIQGRLVSSRSPLNDGDELQVGPLLLVFRLGTAEAGEETVTLRSRSPAS
jgi:DNA-binding winged helix-turn-helix (wHTH) protein